MYVLCIWSDITGYILINPVNAIVLLHDNTLKMSSFQFTNVLNLKGLFLNQSFKTQESCRYKNKILRSDENEPSYGVFFFFGLVKITCVFYERCLKLYTFVVRNTFQI